MSPFQNIPKQLVASLGSDLRNCESPSLLATKFAQPAFKGDDRKSFFNAIVQRENNLRNGIFKGAAERQEKIIAALAGRPDRLLRMKLLSRMMVNLSGGVMENANINIDRFSGIPFIPGSAVKGCARRWAIHELSESENQHTLLKEIVEVFGVADLDWESSDLSDAVEQQRWAETRLSTKSELGESRIGGVCFLAAYSINAPQPAMEVDVLTPHHNNYYSGTLDVALDNEEPIPVYFPVIAPGHIFLFALRPSFTGSDRIVQRAKEWLSKGLQTFGIGAKTASGYGWFGEDVEASNIPQAKASLAADFSEKIYQNAIIARLDKRGEWQVLKTEVEKLKKPENRLWLERFLNETSSKDYRELRKTEWYPKTQK